MTHPAAPRLVSASGFRTDERGEFLPFVLVMMTAVLLVVGFTVDAGRVLAARRELNDHASQAALVAAQQVDGRALVMGTVELSPDAVDAAQSYLAAQGLTGTVRIDRDSVFVETTGTVDPIMFFGMGTKEITGSATARAVRGVEEAET